jgi:hypothetical protein
MCIFCGGACGGVGDSLLPLAAAGIPLVVLKIRSKLDAGMSKRDGGPDKNAKCNGHPAAEEPPSDVKYTS